MEKQLSPSEREVLFGQQDHVRIYGNDYQSILQRRGFLVETHSVPEHYKKYPVIMEETIYICKKPLL